MKRLTVFIILLFAVSCTPEMMENLGCTEPTYEEQETAKTLYNDMFSARVSMSYEEARKIFGCYYYRGDYIYSYSRIFDKGYVLVRGDKAIVYRAVTGE